MITKARGITIGQLSRAAGVNLETIRYYERIRLMPSPPRGEGGHRAYDESHVRWLTFIRRSRELGFSIEDIRALLALAGPEQLPCAKVRDIATSHLEQVRAKQADLARLEAILATSIARCTDDSAVSCPVFDMLDSGGQ